jgi:serine/threonine protein kinase
VKATVSLSDQQAFRHEVFALRQLSHPNVFSFIDVVHYQRNNCIVMEYCGGGDLRSLLNENIEGG